MISMSNRINIMDSWLFALVKKLIEERKEARFVEVNNESLIVVYKKWATDNVSDEDFHS